MRVFLPSYLIDVPGAQPLCRRMERVNVEAVYQYFQGCNPLCDGSQFKFEQGYGDHAE